MRPKSSDDPVRKILNFSPPVPEPRVLVVDDEPVVLEVIAAVLEGRCTVTTADTGNGGLELMNAEHPQVVVTDKNLPDLSGLELIRLGKKVAPDTEFLIITGYASLETAIEAMDLGAFGYITKPFRNIDEVRARIDAALDRNRAVFQNRILVDHLKTAYREQFEASVEIEMMNEVTTLKLQERQREIKKVLDEILLPLAVTAGDAAAILRFLEAVGAGTFDKSGVAQEMGRAKMLAALLEKANLGASELSKSLEVQA